MKRLLFLPIALTLLCGCAANPPATAPQTPPANLQTIEQWGIFEAALNGPSTGNPFLDVDLTARFTSADKSIQVRGFYDGDGIYRIRFMPPTQGSWHYITQSNTRALDSQSGDFLCGPPAADNHGPVSVHNTFHFAYADGTPYVQIGTTCYGWAAEPDPIESNTLDSLKNSPFNKVRMLVVAVKTKPIFYPYLRDENGNWDQSRFNVQFFQHYEKRIGDLRDRNIQADLILFHPYQKGEMEWFDKLDDPADDRYVKYLIARFAAYRNVWWSLANEYGQVKNKTDADWDHFFQLVASEDPYHHLRSIHNAAKYYDPNKPWVTHASIQNGNAVADFGRAVIHRELVRKPIVFDEVCYEGHIDRRWGQLSGPEMVERFWIGTIAGTYVGHGEVLSSPLKISWTSEGGELMGQSPPRLAFLRKILESGPPDGVEPIDEFYENHIGGKAGEYYLVYFGKDRPTQWKFALPRDPPNKTALAQGQKFRVDILDTWNMTIDPIDKIFTVGKFDGYIFHIEGDPKISLPGKPYIALRIQRVS
jgi:hypothetical protein